MGWYHSHPGFGCWLSGVDINTQQVDYYCFSCIMWYYIFLGGKREGVGGGGGVCCCYTLKIIIIYPFYLLASIYLVYITVDKY